MNIVKTYGNYIKKYAGTHPAVSRKMIDIGLHLEQFRTEHFAEKTMPKAYQKLNTLGVKNTFYIFLQFFIYFKFFHNLIIICLIMNTAVCYDISF